MSWTEANTWLSADSLRTTDPARQTARLTGIGWILCPGESIRHARQWAGELIEEAPEPVHQDVAGIVKKVFFYGLQPAEQVTQGIEM